MMPENQKFDTLAGLLENRASINSDKTALLFFENGEAETARITNGDLYLKASMLAAYLQTSNFMGKPVLLIQNSGIEYVVSFFAVCLAGGIPVPAYPPRNNRNSNRIHTIITDTQADLILTTLTIKKNLEKLFEETQSHYRTTMVAVDDFFVNNDLVSDFQFRPSPADICFLQYTSGSTGNPKGVVITHRNLLANLEYIWKERLSFVEQPKMVSWLPLFHDMGLIGGIFTPLWGNFPSLLMPPGAFLQKPYRWLKIISDHTGTISPAPNFAYELCVEKISPENRPYLDLSQWQMVLNGSEKVRAETLEKFSETFAVCGFQKKVFAPCYGLAEATLMVSSVKLNDDPKHIMLSQSELAVGRAQIADSTEKAVSIVSCGKSLANLETVIVNPETKSLCKDNQIGEIWVKGASVAQDYWNKAEESRSTFCNRPAEIETGDFMRTGDLGFKMDDELYITGRIKNLIIIGGQNYYAQDIEKSVEYLSGFFRKSGSAAFSIEKNNFENLVIITEVERSYWNKWKNYDTDSMIDPQKNGADEFLSPRELSKIIRRTISEEFAISVADLLFIKPGKLPKTSSGKIQHSICKKYYLEGVFSDYSLKII